jgi:hypothetical protein
MDYEGDVSKGDKTTGCYTGRRCGSSFAKTFYLTRYPEYVPLDKDKPKSILAVHQIMYEIKIRQSCIDMK